MAEVIDTIISLMSTNWVDANTGDRRPLLLKIWEAKSFQPKNNQEAVLFYEAGNTADYPALAMKWKDEDWLISMDIRTGSRGQMIAIDDEIQRIIDLKITSVAGYSWLEPRGRRDQIQDKNKPYFRMVKDVLVRKLSIVT